MKKFVIVLILPVIISCGKEDDPLGTTFRIESSGSTVPALKNMFEFFEAEALERGVTIERKNLILRYVDDNSPSINDSKAYTTGEQLHIDMDRGFVTNEGHVQYKADVIFLQQFANGILGRAFGNCGIMQKINTANDLEKPHVANYNQYLDHLFDPSKPCQ